MFVYCLEKSALLGTLAEFPHPVGDNENGMKSKAFSTIGDLSLTLSPIFFFIFCNPFWPWLSAPFSSQTRWCTSSAAKASIEWPWPWIFPSLPLYDRDLVFRLFCFVIFSFSFPTRFAGQQNITYRYFARRLSEAKFYLALKITSDKSNEVVIHCLFLDTMLNFVHFVYFFLRLFQILFPKRVLITYEWT